jgi:hypothetical protein
VWSDWVKKVLGHNLKVTKVEWMMALVVIGRFEGKFMKRESLKYWLPNN